MKELLNRLKLGLLPWGIPFIVSFFVWDVQANAPAIPQVWFNVIMGFCLTLGLSIAVYLWSKNTKKKNAKQDSTHTAITWYAQAIVLDIILLVLFFGMSWTDYAPMFLAYAPLLIIPITVGCIMSRK